jgi:hypothetical protein
MVVAVATLHWLFFQIIRSVRAFSPEHLTEHISEAAFALILLLRSFTGALWRGAKRRRGRD